MATTEADADPETPPVETARDELREAVPEAAAALRDMLDAEDDRVRIRAAESILDRAGITKASQKTVTAAERDVGGATGPGGFSPADLL